MAIPTKKTEKIVADGFWTKMQRFAARIPFADDITAAYYCAIDPQTPLRVRGIIFGAIAYFIVPIDLIPDFITGLGFTDDATVLATTLGIVSSYIKPHHYERAREALGLPKDSTVER